MSFFISSGFLCSMPWCWPCLWSLLEHHLLQLQQRGYQYSLKFCLHCKNLSTKSWIIILNFNITTAVAMVTWTKWSHHILLDGHWLKLIVPCGEPLQAKMKNMLVLSRRLQPYLLQLNSCKVVDCFIFEFTLMTSITLITSITRRLDVELNWDWN